MQLDEIPHSVQVELLDMGTLISIPDIPGEPLIIDGEITDPLQQDSYTVKFRGKEFADSVTTIKMFNDESRIWSQEINGSPVPTDAKKKIERKGRGKKGGKAKRQGKK